MKLTPEQIEANKELEQAIDKCVRLFGILRDPEMGEPNIRTDFVVIVEGLKFDDEGDLSEDYYGLLFPNGVLPNAKAKGMCYHALHMLDFGQRCDYNE